jgi:hypothetical protein
VYAVGGRDPTVCSNRVNTYSQSMSAELRKLHGADLTPGDFAFLIEHRFNYSSELVRLVRESDADPSMLLSIMRTLASVRGSGDAYFDREMRRQRCCGYQWCVGMMRAWYLRRLRREADAAHAEGNWFSGAGRTGRRIKVLCHLWLLTWAGIRLRMGMIVDVDDIARDLVNMTASYFTV